MKFACLKFIAVLLLVTLISWKAQAQEPNADFTADPVNGAPPLTVTFSDDSTGQIDSWQWDFGDGTPPGNEQNPVHIYQEAGTYTVSLTVTGTGGSDTETKADYINNDTAKALLGNCRVVSLEIAVPAGARTRTVQPDDNRALTLVDIVHAVAVGAIRIAVLWQNAVHFHINFLPGSTAPGYKPKSALFWPSKTPPILTAKGVE